MKKTAITGAAIAVTGALLGATAPVSAAPQEPVETANYCHKVLNPETGKYEWFCVEW